MAHCPECGAATSWEHVCNAYCVGETHADLAYFDTPLPRDNPAGFFQALIRKHMACEHMEDIVLSIRLAPEAPEDAQYPWLTEKYLYFFTNPRLKRKHP